MAVALSRQKMCVLMAGLLSACVAASPPAPPAPEPAAAHTLTEQEAALVLPAVADRFKDPSSLQVRHLAAARSLKDGRVWVCGEVNGKNSFGGYVGFEPFYGYLQEDRFVPVAVGGPEMPAQNVVNSCRHYGITLARDF